VLETSGNQAYVFATNKLRENVGASELTRRAGTKWVFEAVEGLTHRNLYRDDPTEQRAVLTDRALNPSVEDGALVEIVEAISGKAILLVKDEKTANAIVQAVTLTALREAPGMEVKGAVAHVDWSQPGSVPLALKQAYRRYEELRTAMNGPESRFLRLPFVAECASSGMPAAEVDKDGKPISLQTRSKRQAAEGVHDVASRLWAPEGWRFAYALDDAEWVAVVHADGNGLGQVFLDFEDYCGSTAPVDNRQYVDALRRFSCAVDVCTHHAFRSAAAAVVDLAGDAAAKCHTLPLRPLVLSGDDMTVVCEGKVAMSFVATYLQEFERETGSDDDTRVVAERMTHGAMPHAWLSAGAGIALVKSHYPFYAAYDLAEELASHAKDAVKKSMRQAAGGIWPCSTLDFHVLHDSSAMQLHEIRSKLEVDNGTTLLYGTPYVVTPIAKFDAAPLDSGQRSWVALHAWDRLATRVNALRAKNKDGRRALPNSQVHELRAALFGGKAAADAALQLIEHRYDDSGVEQLAEDRAPGGRQTLFSVQRQQDGKDTCVTLLLDAMEAEDFLPTEQSDPGKGAVRP